MWTVERLRAQAEMFGLIGRWDSWIGPWLEFMAALLNAYQHPDLMDAAADFTVGMMMMELREPRSAEEFRRAVCEGIAGSFGIAAGPQVGRVPAPADAAPAAPAAPPSPRRFIPPADDLRTPTALERGLRIARFAERQGGRFRWLPRGEEGGLPVQTTGHSHSGRGVNHFWLWVQGPATELPVDASLNCWEFVLYCATAAGALSRGRLRAAYEGAALSARKEFGEANLHALQRESLTEERLDALHRGHGEYKARIFRLLGGDTAVKISRDPEPGDGAQRGDFVFLNDLDHVCICLGSSPRGTLVMSLWTQKGGRATIIRLQDLYAGKPKVTIRPCPF